MLTYKLSPSILSIDFFKLAEGIQSVEKANADMLHLDVMDGVFVPNISFGPDIVHNISKNTDLPLDVHLMITQPERYVERFVQAGASNITIQVESTVHLDRVIRQIKDLGCKASLTLNPATPLSHIQYLLPEVDMVLVMTINPGFGGQKLIPYTLDKIKELRDMAPDLNIQVDGGVKLSNINELMDAGANIFVVGSGIFSQPDIHTSCKEFKSILNQRNS